MKAHARRNDPDPSHEAAESIGDLRPRLLAVHNMLAEYGPMTDYELTRLYAKAGLIRQSPSGVRSRRAELVKQGLVEWTGDKVVLPSGRRAMVWGVPSD